MYEQIDPSLVYTCTRCTYFLWLSTPEEENAVPVAHEDGSRKPRPRTSPTAVKGTRSCVARRSSRLKQCGAQLADVENMTGVCPPRIWIAGNSWAGQSITHFTFHTCALLISCMITSSIIPHLENIPTLELKFSVVQRALSISPFCFYVDELGVLQTP